MKVCTQLHFCLCYDVVGKNGIKAGKDHPPFCVTVSVRWYINSHSRSLLRGVCATPVHTGLRPFYVRGYGSRGVFGDRITCVKRQGVNQI